MSTYLFDFDGVLVDSMPYFTSVMLDILSKNNVVYSDDLVNIITPLGYNGTAKYYVEQLGLPFIVNDLVDIMHEMLYPAYRDKIELKQGVNDYLHHLKRNGHSLNILSASPKRMVVVALSRCGIYELFDHIWSCEEFGMTKCETKIYHEAVKAAEGNVDDTLFFDDNLEAIKAAAKSGVCTIAVYDKTNLDYMKELRKVANKYIYTFDDLIFDE